MQTSPIAISIHNAFNGEIQYPAHLPRPRAGGSPEKPMKKTAFVFRADDGTWAAHCDRTPNHPVREAPTLRACMAEARAKGYSVRRAKDCDARVKGAS